MEGKKKKTLARPVSCCSGDFNCTLFVFFLVIAKMPPSSDEDDDNDNDNDNKYDYTGQKQLGLHSCPVLHRLPCQKSHFLLQSQLRSTELHGLPFKPHLPKLPKAPPMRPHFLPVPSKTTQKNKGSARICTFTPFDSRKPLIATVLII